MKSAQFPLLRSSPAAGTGSYGALPITGGGESSYAGSSLSTSTASGEHDGKDSDQENENEAHGLLEEPTIKRRGKRKANTTSASVVTGFHGVDGAEEEGATVESDGEDEEDENDPIDNSP
jgi:hypothetical protein